MQVVYTHCAGLDVHKKTVVACAITPNQKGGWQKEIRNFSTMTKDLLNLSDWLTSKGCTHVAMESTGDYWRPVFNILEGNVEVMLVNARHIKAVPGRKTDIKDSQWIAELLQHGLLRRALYSRSRAKRFARLNPTSQQLCPRKSKFGQSRPKSPRSSQHQTGLCGQ